MKADIFSHFSNEMIVDRSENFIKYEDKLKNANFSASVYPVYKGFEVTELIFKAKRFSPIVKDNRRIVEINYCRKGRTEFKMKDGCFQYVGEGDLFLSMEKNHSDTIEFPLGYYSGTVVMVDLEIASEAIKSLLPSLEIDLNKLFDRLFKHDDCLLLLSRDSIQQIFAGIDTVPEAAKSVYLLLKIQELIIYLNYLDIDKERKKKTYTKLNVDIIKQIHEQITKNPDIRFTIDDLSRQYCISATTLKSTFKGVYGSSIAKYMKLYRIEQSAVLLRDSKKSIAEISQEIGYNSQSKFGAAFKEIMKITPIEYRKKYEDMDKI